MVFRLVWPDGFGLVSLRLLALWVSLCLCFCGFLVWVLRVAFAWIFCGRFVSYLVFWFVWFDCFGV